MGLCELGEGWVEEHLHSYEESFYVLEGEPVLYLDGRGVRLRPGACGVVPVGVEHGWRGRRGHGAVGGDVLAASAGEGGPADTFFVGRIPEGGTGGA